MERTPQSAGDSSDLARLVRWERAGGIWEVVASTAYVVTLGLRRCDGGEEVDRFSTCDPLALLHLDGRLRSDE